MDIHRTTRWPAQLNQSSFGAHVRKGWYLSSALASLLSLLVACANTMPSPSAVVSTAIIFSPTATLPPSLTPTLVPTATPFPPITETPTIIPTQSPISTIPPLADLQNLSGSNIQKLRLLTTLPAADHFETGIRIAFISDGKQVAIGHNAEVIIWDLTTTQITKVFDVSTDNFAVSPDGKLLASSVDNLASVLDFSSSQVLNTLQAGDSLTQLVLGLAFSPDNKHLVTTTYTGGNIRIWNVSDGKLLSSQVGSSGEYEAAFSPNGKLLISAGRDGKVRQWNPRNGQLLQEIKACFLQTTEIEFSPDGHYLVAKCYDDFGFGNGYDNAVRIYDVSSWQQLRTIGDDNVRKNSVSFTPDGRIIAFGVGDPPTAIEFWEVSNGQLLYSLGGFSGRYPMLSPDGHILAIGAIDGTTQIWGVVGN